MSAPGAPRGVEPTAAPASDTALDVLSMLEVGESDAVPEWVAQRLTDMHPETRGRLLRIHPAKASRVKDLTGFEVFSVAEWDSGAAPVPLGADADLAAAIRNTAPLVLAPGGARLLATIQALGEVRYVVELEGNVGAAATDERVASLLAIAQRYYQHLVDAETDPLTKLATRRLFHDQVERGIRRWAASERTFYLALLDLDRFKRINDEYGHLYGDEILVRFADVLRRSFRAGDQLYRFGGEEFVAIFGVDPGHGGEGVLERLRLAVEGYDFPGVGRVTVSIGYTRIADPATPAAMLVERADRAMYYSKRGGRNRVSGWEYLVEAGELKAAGPAKGDVTLF